MAPLGTSGVRQERGDAVPAATRERPGLKGAHSISPSGPATIPATTSATFRCGRRPERERAGEIGYWIRSDATGKGIATEAAARITDIAFSELGLHRVTLRIAVGNRPSERIAEKLGYVHEGLLREEVLVRGTWLDHTLWAMLEDEYQRRRELYREAGWLESQPFEL